MTKLLIVESPTKAKKIASFLGVGWQVQASYGHIRDLPVKEIGVGPPDFRPHYDLNMKAKGGLSKLRAASSTAAQVYLATDPDREGEAISWHLEQVLKLKNAQRITFNEITKDAITKALQQPREIDRNLVQAQEARRVLDRLVGYLVSPVLSRRANTPLSAGRVQSVALRLVVEREREIAKFVPTTHYGARLNFNTQGLAWSADWEPAKYLVPGADLCLDRALAQAVSDVRQLEVSAQEHGTRIAAAPPPYTTSSLQQAASVSLGISPKNTMRLAQCLFEQGLISYHRTDSPNLSPEAIADICEWLTAAGMVADLPDKPNSWKAKQGAQEAHEAIRPTHIKATTINADDPLEMKLYRLIWERAVASQMKAAHFATTLIRLEATAVVAGKPPTFLAKGEMPTYPGWMRLVGRDRTEEEIGEGEGRAPQMLPDLAAGAPITANAGGVLEKLTKASPRFTEASLIKRMEQEGVGRPSTYAAILDNIVSREYVAIVKKKLQATGLGYQLVTAMVGRFRFVEIDFTRTVEGDLDRVAQGETSYLAVVKSLHDQLQLEITSFAGAGPGAKPASLAAVHVCPAQGCGKPMRRIPGKNGVFWGCMGYPGCKTSLPDRNGRPVAKTESGGVRTASGHRRSAVRRKKTGQ